MTESARNKLKESHYFFERMGDTKTEPEFQYNVSAFFSAARSVTFYLQKEYRSTEGFEEWYEAKQEEMRGSTLFRVMLTIRNYVVKEDYPSVTGLSMKRTNDEENAEISEMSLETWGMGSEEMRQLSENFGFQSEEIEVISMEILHQQLSSEYQRKPLLEICEEYLDELDRLLSDWEDYIS